MKERRLNKVRPLHLIIELEKLISKLMKLLVQYVSEAAHL